MKFKLNELYVTKDNELLLSIQPINFIHGYLMERMDGSFCKSFPQYVRRATTDDIVRYIEEQALVDDFNVVQLFRNKREIAARGFDISECARMYGRVLFNIRRV